MGKETVLLARTSRYHSLVSPPESIPLLDARGVALRGVDEAPCCWAAWECALAHDDFGQGDFRKFACLVPAAERREYKLRLHGTSAVLDSCAEYRAALGAAAGLVTNASSARQEPESGE